MSQANPVIVVCAVPHGLAGAFNSISFVNCGTVLDNHSATSGFTPAIVDVLTLSIDTLAVGIDGTTLPAYTGGGSIQLGGGSGVYISAVNSNLYFNWMYHFPSRPLSWKLPATPGGATANYKYNLMEQGAYAYYSHLNYQEWGTPYSKASTPGVVGGNPGDTTSVWNGITPAPGGLYGGPITSVVEYNLIRQTIVTVSGGEGFQLAANGNAIFDSPQVNYNVAIGQSDDPLNYTRFPNFSYIFHNQPGLALAATPYGPGPSPQSGYQTNDIVVLGCPWVA